MANNGTQSQGARLRAWREQAGLTQQQLADALGTGPSFISRLERDVHSPTVDMLCRLAEALGVDARDLLVCPDATVPAAEAV